MPTPRSSSGSELAPLLVVIARGSTEPVHGSRLLTPLARDINRTYPGEGRIVNLRYPATVEFFDPVHPARIDLGESPAEGTRNLANLLNVWAAANRAGRTVLLGWSQGAMVIADALADDRAVDPHRPALASRAEGSIAAVALFGNPTFTAGETFNVGDFRPGVSGVLPRQAGTLDKYADRLRDYCARGDLVAQAHPSSSVEGHVAYFHNGMLASAAEFVAGRLSASFSQLRDALR